MAVATSHDTNDSELHRFDRFHKVPVMTMADLKQLLCCIRDVYIPELFKGKTIKFGSGLFKLEDQADFAEFHKRLLTLNYYRTKFVHN